MGDNDMDDLSWSVSCVWHVTFVENDCLFVTKREELKLAM